jgi:serpin B
MTPRTNLDDLAFVYLIVPKLAELTVDTPGERTERAPTATALRLPSPPFPMVVDRPFLFLIEDRPTQTILFLGVVFDPKSG